jgi:hypothetical protein
MNHSVMNTSSTNVLSKSINQFNSSIKSSEGDNKKISSGIPKKSGLLKKIGSSESHDVSGIGGVKKLIPNTQRQELPHSDLN